MIENKELERDAFIIIVAPTIRRLSNKVNANIKLGYAPYGRVIVDNDLNERNRFAQSMTDNYQDVWI